MFLYFIYIYIDFEFFILRIHFYVTTWSLANWNFCFWG